MLDGAHVHRGVSRNSVVRAIFLMLLIQLLSAVITWEVTVDDFGTVPQQYCCTLISLKSRGRPWSFCIARSLTEAGEKQADGDGPCGFETPGLAS